MAPGTDTSTIERTWIDRIHHAGKKLALTVERMLSLLKTEQLGPIWTFQNVDLEPLLRRSIADLQPFLQARHQDVLVHVAAGLGWAEVDPPKLSDILTNLVVNAIKFTPDGGTIHVEAGPKGEDHVKFVVADRGLGIPPADCTHLFEPFFTGNDTMHHSSGEYQFGKRGMGLGLCLVKTFVELHGGTIKFDTVAGRGSTFTFTLPRKRGA